MENHSMLKYKIVLVSFPFDDLSSSKVRPAVCLTEPVGSLHYVILAFVTSRIAAESLVTDIIIDAKSPDFTTTGLRVSSTLQLHHVMTARVNMIQRELGQLPTSLQLQVKERLHKLFDLA
jgi:mRNA interferase MazF